MGRHLFKMGKAENGVSSHQIVIILKTYEVLLRKSTAFKDKFNRPAILSLSKDRAQRPGHHASTSSA